jgi:hypothetical protein
MYGVEYPIYEQFYDKFEPLTRGGSTMRRIRYGSTTDGDGWQAEFAASLANSGLAPLTVRAYRHDVGLFLKWFAAIKGGLECLALGICLQFRLANYLRSF